AIDVDADHLVAVPGQAGPGDTADVAQAEHAHAHGSTSARSVSKSRATRSQEKRSSTSRRPAAPRLRQRAGSESRETTAPAKLAGSSARTKGCPSTSGRPSAPIVVDTTGLPIDRASKILSRVPPPTRSGTM